VSVQTIAENKRMVPEHSSTMGNGNKDEGDGLLKNTDCTDICLDSKFGIWRSNRDKNCKLAHSC
jgi:hypothetical protein